MLSVLQCDVIMMVQLNIRVGGLSTSYFFLLKGVIFLIENKPDMVRVNTRISNKANAWLDEQSFESGVPKSTLILLAIENYMREKEAIAVMSDMGQLVSAIEKLEKTVERNALD